MASPSSDFCGRQGERRGILMDKKKKLGQKLIDLYAAVGTVAMGLLALLVVFAVIMRYCFSLSWKGLSEFNVLLFAFTTFWGLGLNILKGEHVIIDIFYDGVKPAAKRWLSVFNYVVVLIVDLVLTYQGWLYTLKMGKQISQGMEIPMYFMYGIIPVCGALCAVCVVVKIVEFIRADSSYFAPRNQAVTKKPEERG